MLESSSLRRPVDYGGSKAEASLRLPTPGSQLFLAMSDTTETLNPATLNPNLQTLSPKPKPLKSNQRASAMFARKSSRPTLSAVSPTLALSVFRPGSPERFYKGKKSSKKKQFRVSHVSWEADVTLNSYKCLSLEVLDSRTPPDASLPNDRDQRCQQRVQVCSLSDARVCPCNYADGLGADGVQSRESYCRA